MAEMTAAERGAQMLKSGGYHRHKDGGDIHNHPDAAEDKKLIRHELGKARITTRNKGGKIKGHKAAEHPGRRHRAAGGGVDHDAQINERHPPGDDQPSSRARGGAAKHSSKPGIGKVNIVIAHPGGGEPGAPPMAPPHPPMAAPPPAAPPPPRPMMPPPGGMPGGAGGPPMAPRPMMPPGGGAGMPPGGGMGMRPPGARAGGRIRDELGRFSGGSV